MTLKSCQALYCLRLTVLVLILFFSGRFVNAQPWLPQPGTSNIFFTAGSVGIGTNTPQATLDVKGTVNAGSTLDLTRQDGFIGGAYIVVDNAGTQSINLAKRGGGNFSYLGINADGSEFKGNVSLDQSLFMNSNQPTLSFNVLNAATDTKRTNLFCGSNFFAINMVNDAWTTGTNPLMIYRSGQNATDMLLQATNTKITGSVCIGTTNPGSNKLAVEGTIAARKVIVTLANPFPDYVFEKGYSLLSLKDLETYVQNHKHLPDMPSADSVAKNGLDLGNNQADLLKKIEELTLYVIEQNKELNSLKVRNQELEEKNTQLTDLKKRMDYLEQFIKGKK